MGVAELSSPPVGEFVSVDGYKIHYLRYGQGEPVVLLHGSGPGSNGYSNFKQNLDTIVQAGCEAIVIDLLGFGYSDKPMGCDYTTELFAETTHAAIRAIGIDTEYVLLGNSLGGAIAIRIALDHPEAIRGLVLMAPGGLETLETYLSMDGMSQMITRFTNDDLAKSDLRQILESLVFDPKLVSDGLVEERFAIYKLQNADVLKRMSIPPMDEEIGKLTCPIIGFWGAQDAFNPVSGAQKMLEKCRNCRFVIVSSCGHWVMVEHCEMFNGEVTQFLEAVTG